MPIENAIEVYNSEHLKIKFAKNLSIFLHEWNHNQPIPTAEFGSEMIAFLETFKIHRPKNVLWLQEDFTTILSHEDHLWIENNINKECVELGLEKCAFVIGKDIIAQMQVFNFFEKTKSCLTTKHFSDITDALSWISQDKSNNDLNSIDFDITFKGKTPDGKSLYTLETASQNIDSVLKSFNHILQENAFLKLNSTLFFSLTIREKDIFQRYANGVGIKEIAEELFLSELTVRTHWRNAQKKLNIKSHSDISAYKNSFFL